MVLLKTGHWNVILIIQHDHSVGDCRCAGEAGPKKVSVELMDSDSLQRGLDGHEIHHAKPTRVVYKISVDSDSYYERAKSICNTPLLKLLFIPGRRNAASHKRKRTSWTSHWMTQRPIRRPPKSRPASVVIWPGRRWNLGKSPMRRWAAVVRPSTAAKGTQVSHCPQQSKSHPTIPHGAEVASYLDPTQLGKTLKNPHRSLQNLALRSEVNN